MKTLAVTPGRSSVLTICLLILFMMSSRVNAQSYNMSNTPVTTCSGTFYDSGGPAGNYADNAGYNQTFTSAAGERLVFAFTSFSTYNGNDVLYIYDGPTNAYPLIGAYSGGASPGTVTSSGSSLTFVFSVNNSGTSTAGWVANISCTGTALTTYNMSSGTVNACSGVFYDNGGASAAYPVNENRTQTFCSDNGEYLQFVFNNASFGLASGDTLFIYDGATTSSSPLATLVSGSIAETITSSGTCITFRFKSDGTTTSLGWQARFSCTPTQPSSTNYNMSSGVRNVCGGSFFDDGGAAGNYNDAASHTQTFTSYNGNRLQFAFTSFATYNTSDVLYIYDGPSSSYPLIGAYSGGGSPGTVQSSGTSLTFVFSVNNAGSSAAGWAATISCTAAPLSVYNMNTGTMNTCSGVFYDNGGANANYPANENRTQTFCSDNGQYLQFTFNNTAFGLGSGDSLFIYDGPTTASSPLAVLVAGSYAETITSSGTCITFRFKSDGTTNAQGWQANISCTSVQPAPVSYNMSAGVRYTCGGSFYDDGGSGGNYNDYVSRTQSFHSYNGNRLQFTFTSLSTATTADYLRIYDGPTSASPLIGTYSVSSNPGTITSTGSSLTFVYVTNSAGSSASGWAASISCTTPVLPVYNMSSGTVNACSGVFYDNGGASATYPNNENRIQTFCSDNGEYLQFTFNNNAYGLGTGDSLFIYDGPGTSSSPLAVYVAGSYAETVTSSGTCLTFRFKSDGSLAGQGWQASFSCTPVQPSGTTYNMSAGVRYTCGGSFYDNGGSGGNYNDYVNQTQTFHSYNGNRLQFTFSYFNTSTTADYMRIYDGPSTAYPLIGTYSVSSNPGTILSTGSSLTFVFVTNGAGSSTAGWAASITCSTPVLPVYDMNSGTVNACSGVFYDFAGAAASYPNSENRTQTFCSDNGEFMQFTFNNAAFGLGAGDSLFIYDGANTSAAPLAILVSGSIAETVTSTGTCMTFRFKSDATTTGQGWQATFNCTPTQPAPTTYIMSAGVRYTCGGTFYDDGGASGNYNDYASHTQTFASYNGNRLQFTFSIFNTSTTADYLRIYDGPTTAYPLIGTYSVSSNPGTITSTGSSLTFVFITNGAGSSTAGFAASISCITPTLPVYNMNSGTVTSCSGVFYDNGGASQNYPASENRTQTFCSDNGQHLQFTFNNTAFGLASGDSLFIYDGTGTSSQLIAVHVAGSYVEQVTSTGTCLTFRFKSDATTQSQGWQGTFNCTPTLPSAPVFNMSAGIRYTCGGTFYDDGGASGNYYDFTSHVQTFVSTGGCGLRATFNSFNTSTTADYLRIYDGPSTASPLIGTYSVSTSPGIVQASGTALTFQFITNSAGSSTAGWNATLSCPNQTAPPVITSNSPVCEGDSIELSSANIPGASFTWTGPNGFTSSVQNPVIPISVLADSGIYTVSATVGGCTSNQTTTNVSVHPRPASPVATNNGPVCSGNALNLSSTSVNGASSYSWTGPSSFTSSAQNPVIPTATTNATGTYTVTAQAGVCSVSATTAATVYQSPQITSISSNSPVCSGNAINLSSTVSSASSYSWSGPNGFSSALQNASIPNAQSVHAGTYTLTASNSNCSTVSTVVVNVSASPSNPVLSSNSAVCAGDTLRLYSTGVAGATYQWSGPSFSSTLQNPVINPAAVSHTGTFTLTVSLNGCSVSSTIPVVVNSVPSTPAIATNTPVCSGDTIMLSTAGVSGATYNWSGPNGFSSSAQNPEIMNADFSDAGNYSLVVEVNGCQSPMSTQAVIVNTVSPVASSGGTACEGSAVNLYASTVSGASYSWTGPGSFSSANQNPVIPNATASATGTYTVVATIGSCASSPSTVSVIVNPVPASASASSNSPVCSGSQLELYASTVPGVSYSWTGPQGFNSTSEDPVIASPLPGATGTYTVVTMMNGCSSAPSMVSVTVNAIPLTPVAGSNDPICEGGTLNLSAASTNGATYSWSGPGGFTSADQYPTISNVTNAMAGSYSVTATLNGCTSSAGTETVIVYSAPAAPVISWNQTLGTLTSSYSNGNQWYLNGNILNGETSNVLYYPVHASNGPYTVLYTDANGCSSTSAPYTVNPVGIAANSFGEFRVYPNPGDGAFTVKLPGDDERTLILLNSIGQVVFKKQIHGSEEFIDLKGMLAPGIYELNVISEKVRFKEKVVIR